MMVSGIGTSARIELHYEVRSVPDAWELPEILVPESRPHELLVEHLKGLLVAWVERTERDAIVARNLAFRWIQERPKVGVDPDLCLIEPTPPGAADLTSLCTWTPGHSVPRLAIEVVSPGHPYKDYAVVQDKYAVSGVRELWVIDARLQGPRSHGGPVPLQLWRSDRGGPFRCVYRGGGPVEIEALGAWVRVAGESVEIADDPGFVQRWQTPLEIERAAKEQERAAKEQERAAKEQERAAKEQERAAKEQERARAEELERRVLELEAKVARGR